MGVTNSVSEIAELSGRRLVDDDGTIIRRTSPDDPNGCDIYISTSSAGGGLQMMVAGVVKQMTAASAKRAALGAGAIVMDTIASNDKRRPHEQIQRIRELRPDMVLISGGTDGGNTTQVVQIGGTDRAGEAAPALRRRVPAADHLRGQQGCPPRGREGLRGTGIRSFGRREPASARWSRRTSARHATASTTCSSSTSWPMRRATTSS